MPDLKKEEFVVSACPMVICGEGVKEMKFPFKVTEPMSLSVKY